MYHFLITGYILVTFIWLDLRHFVCEGQISLGRPCLHFLVGHILINQQRLIHKLITGRKRQYISTCKQLSKVPSLKLNIYIIKTEKKAFRSRFQWSKITYTIFLFKGLQILTRGRQLENVQPLLGLYDFTSSPFELKLRNDSNHMCNFYIHQLIGS